MFDTAQTFAIKDEVDYEVQDFDRCADRCANCRYRISTHYPSSACRKLSDKIGTNVYISEDGICKHYERKNK